MYEAKQRYFDSRTYDRYLKKGLITQKEYDQHLKALPDDEAGAAWVQMDVHETELSADEPGDEEDN